MEPAVGVFLNEDWDSLSRMFSSDDHDLFPNDGLIFGNSSTFWLNDFEGDTNNIARVDEGLLYSSSDTLNSNFLYFSQESSNSSGGNNCASFPTPSHENHQFCESNFIPLLANNVSESMDFCVMENKNINDSLVQVFFDDNVMEEILCLKEETGNGDLGNANSQRDAIDDTGKEMKLKRKLEQPEVHEPSENPKKKTRVSRDAQKNKKNTQSKKNQKLTSNGNNGEETNVGPIGQSSTCYTSEDDSNGSQEDPKGFSALNSNGKTRASRGSATDPQSLYARKRRERINERLRILQNLVPNGTKVDISTMLEEAVHYVKFLQLQIKLLSSDDMWMYAPIAYNGMDMGLYQNISPTL